MACVKCKSTVVPIVRQEPFKQIVQTFTNVVKKKDCCANQIVIKSFLSYVLPDVNFHKTKIYY